MSYETRQARYLAAHPEAMREGRLRRKYGLTLGDLALLAVAQDNQCVLCGDLLDWESPRGDQRPCVDHNHATGHVRGVLHSRCNTSLGTFEQVRERAEAYLSGGKA